MRNSARVPARFPIGTKYVLESNGLVVRRYIEFPDGRKVSLAVRKARTCAPCTQAARHLTSIVPDRRPSEADALLQPVS